MWPPAPLHIHSKFSIITMDKFSYPIYLITAMLLLTGIPQLSCKPIYPGEAPAPTLFDCMPSFNSMFYCLSFVEPGSNLTRPDPLCCPGFAAVVNKNPICLCQFLANTSVVPVHVDVQRSLMLPNVCNVKTLPPSACSIVGFPIPPSSAPAEPAPMSHVPPPHPLAPQLRTLPTAPHPPAQEPPPQHSPLFASPRNRMPLVLGLGIGVPVLLVFVGTMVFFQRKNIINRPELELPPRGAIDRNDHVYRSPAHLLQNYSASPDIDEQVPAAALCFYLNSERQDQQSTAHTINSNRKTRFNYEELFLATNHFSRNTLLGEGGFGNVHKGVLDDGKHVAIKQLKLDSRQGEREFQTEVETVSRVHHRHLVSLVGYCISGAKRLLVYEFVPNDSLEFHLHGAGRPCMSWETRMKIAFGCSKGLAYLHEDCQPKIIHQDIKSSNILLDENFEAKVADFGLARFYLDGETHISTRVMGTFGYLAPEYALTGKITEKSDVFSFGVVLLELITGHRPIDKTNAYHGDHIINWARPLLKEALDNNNFDSVADPRLHKNYDSIEITRMVTCAFACVHHLARCRPNMSQVVCALEGVLSLDDLVCDTEKDDKMKKKL